MSACADGFIASVEEGCESVNAAVRAPPRAMRGSATADNSRPGREHTVIGPDRPRTVRRTPAPAPAPDPSAQADIAFSQPRIHSPRRPPPPCLTHTVIGPQPSANRPAHTGARPRTRPVGAGRHRVFPGANSFAPETRPAVFDTAIGDPSANRRADTCTRLGRCPRPPGDAPNASTRQNRRHPTVPSRIRTSCHGPSRSVTGALQQGSTLRSGACAIQTAEEEACRALPGSCILQACSPASSVAPAVCRPTIRAE
jgi:hypothetical protein